MTTTANTTVAQPNTYRVIENVRIPAYVVTDYVNHICACEGIVANPTSAVSKTDMHSIRVMRSIREQCNVFGAEISQAVLLSSTRTHKRWGIPGHRPWFRAVAKLLSVIDLDSAWWLEGLEDHRQAIIDLCEEMAAA